MDGDEKIVEAETVIESEKNPEPEDKESLEWIRWKLESLQVMILEMRDNLELSETRSADRLSEALEPLIQEMSEIREMTQKIKTLEESEQRENQSEESPLATPPETPNPGAGDSVPMEHPEQSPDERQAEIPQAPSEPAPSEPRRNARVIRRV